MALSQSYYSQNITKRNGSDILDTQIPAGIVPLHWLPSSNEDVTSIGEVSARKVKNLGKSLSLPTSNFNKVDNETTKANVQQDVHVANAKQFDSLKKLLECPVCLKSPGTSMYLCVKGHSICSGCRSKVNACPLCKQALLNTRNLLVEKILSTLETECKFAKEGCTQVLLAGQKNDHIGKCYFRPILCNFASDHHVCKQASIRYTNYIKHLITVHKMIGVKDSVINVSQSVQRETLSLTTDIPWQDWPIQYLEAFNETFITGSTISSGKLCWWLYVFGDHNLSSKYSVKITLSDRYNKGMSMSWSGPVASIRAQPDTIMKRGLCLMVCKENFRPFTSTSKATTVKNTAAAKNDSVTWNIAFKVFKKSITEIQN